MYESILSQLKTKKQADLLVEGLNNLKNAQYHPNKDNFSDIVKQEIGDGYAQELIKLTDSNNSSDHNKLIEDLVLEIESMQVIILTIAFEPRAKSVEKIHDWVSQNISNSILINLEVDESIIGGAQISYKGKYDDFSLQKIIETDFNANANYYLNIVKK